ncbi:hypothetical protein KTE49_04525 [Burkholderia multivorans]|uniref:hypothetical protein n=2 Tax=Burkholderia multivorans TaxID=87883 RepID=UPI00158C99F4|nr:hypothetical protein [Burkholderia multivorans]MBJ9618321.1 hypothetical protein [Burkholderia multivorans]MBU9529719.1 hypothetical protein [Burkholderia multivorans]MDR8782382.1 hypothetical protein [Burkholderia multivorans]MDR8823375.1 hypothetical protein [Burkholderia multivorans]
MLARVKANWIYIVLISLFVGLSVRGAQPNLWGDGIEYALMAEALTAHATPNITADDYRRVQSYPGDVGTNVTAVADRSSLSKSPPFFRDARGHYYSYHFWLYSLFVAPLFFLVKLFGVATPWAFLATNLIFALGASYAICTWREVGREQRLLLLTLYWSCGTIPYIRWTHPEVFSASLLVVSMVMVWRRRYVAAAAAAAVVAQQNPPVLLLAAGLLAIDFFANFKKTGSIVPPIRKMVGWFFCIAVASISIIFFFIHFGTGNLIAKSGGADVRLMSVERLWSFYFDINQGVIVLLWPLLAMVPAIMMCAFVSRGARGVKYVGVVGLVFTSVILAAPSLSTLNFNHGQSFISRYAYWACVPLLFAVAALYVESVGSKLVVRVGVACFVICNIVLYSRAWPSYLYYTTVSERVMDKFPEIYNPVPEIFIERGVHIDGAMNPEHIYYYANDKGVRKIILNDRRRNVDDFFCSGGERARDYVTSVSRVEQGWVYYNLKYGCTALFTARGEYEKPPALTHGMTLRFDEQGSGKLYLDRGWSHQEPWGTWSDGPEASIVLPLSDAGVGQISLRANALVSAKRPEQKIVVYVNGVNAGVIVLRAANGNNFNIQVPVSVIRSINESKIMRLKFKFLDSTRPKDIGINGDDRMLAMGLVSLTIN